MLTEKENLTDEQRDTLRKIIEDYLSEKILTGEIKEDSDIEVGDKVISSGIGEVYPRGLLIGKVIEFFRDDRTRTLVAVVEPAADLDSISKVMIITEYEITSERGE